ncbi:MAG: DUF4271 domain-containing protein [Bacteroidales bacterium]
MQITFSPALPVNSMYISDLKQNISAGDTARLKTDSLVHFRNPSPDIIRTADSVLQKKTHSVQVTGIMQEADTATMCTRNPAANIVFRDSPGTLSKASSPDLMIFPYNFIEKNVMREVRANEILVSHLQGGKEMPVKPFHEDWIILIILAAAFIYAWARIFAKSMFPGIIRFFSFRQIGDPESCDIGVIFRWQSTLINLISFFNIALFAYCAAFYYDLIPPKIAGIVFWLIAIACIAASVTARHLVCYAVGKLSGETKLFNEYIITIYQSYRVQALILLILVILLSYTGIFNVGPLFMAGFAAISVSYILRIVRLFLIFIKRNVSILYLILYLCALEFLPALVLLKYLTGLF